MTKNSEYKNYVVTISTYTDVWAKNEEEAKKEALEFFEMEQAEIDNGWEVLVSEIKN
jgi:hypothetical protein